MGIECRMVDAVRWMGGNLKAMVEFVGAERAGLAGEMNWEEREEKVRTGGLFISGTIVCVGDWIVKCADGDFVVCPHDVFEETYGPTKEILEEAAEKRFELGLYGFCFSSGREK
jgi:hypothetical protein